MSTLRISSRSYVRSIRNHESRGVIQEGTTPRVLVHTTESHVCFSLAIAPQSSEAEWA